MNKNLVDTAFEDQKIKEHTNALQFWVMKKVMKQTGCVKNSVEQYATKCDRKS